MKNFVKSVLSSAGLELRRSPDPRIPYLHQLNADSISREFWIANTQTREWWGNPVLDFNSEFQELKRLCTPGSTVVEIGAHHGMMTLLLSRCSGPEGHVYAVEASADNAVVLDANCFKNRVSNVSTHFVAIGRDNGMATFGGESLAAASGTARQVKMQTLDSFCRDHNIDGVDLLKIDVEGFEHDVLAGASELFSRCRPKIALELHVDLLRELGSSAQAVWERMEECGLLTTRSITMLARPDWDKLREIEKFQDIPGNGVVNLFIG